MDIQGPTGSVLGSDPVEDFLSFFFGHGAGNGGPDMDMELQRQRPNRKDKVGAVTLRSAQRHGKHRHPQLRGGVGIELFPMQAEVTILIVFFESIAQTDVLAHPGDGL